MPSIRALSFVAALASSFAVGCLPPVFDSGVSCCSCLLTHDGNGEQLADPNAEGANNCIAGAASSSDDNNTCANRVAEAVNGVETGPVPITSESCITDACATECGRAEADGLTFAVPADDETDDG